MGDYFWDAGNTEIFYSPAEARESYFMNVYGAKQVFH